MDWQLRIALIIVGLGIIGFIVYDFNRRKKLNKDKQRLINQMRQSADQVDSAGFDITGVGSVRKVGDDPELSEENAPSPTAFENSSVDLEQKSRPEVISEPKPDVIVSEEVPRGGSQMSLDGFSEPEMVCSLILKAKQGEAFKGRDFMPLLLSQGIRHGEMGIFHRHSGVSGKPGPVMYSVANAVKPGTFELTNIEVFETPAFAFFMMLPGPKDPVVAYEGMVKTMRMLKQELGGQILDETKSVYTEQTHQHQLDSIREYLTRANIK